MAASMLSRGIGYADMARQVRRIRRSNDERIRAIARSHLAERMGRLRGLPQKIGQILSMTDDESAAQPFRSLTEASQALPFETIEPILEAAWGRPIHRVVSDVNPHGLAGSLGQVHRAVLLDGRPVAVKVQYPGIRDAVMNDLRVLGWLSAPAGDLRRGFDLAAYRAEILRDLDDELNYRTEAAHQRRFATLSGELPDWLVPYVIDDLSNEHVLVTEWIDGEPIEAAAKWNQTARDVLARNLVAGFFHLLFHHGLIHADPHPGNYRFALRPDGPRIVLYDFGSVATMPREAVVALLKLIEITVNKHGDPYKPLVALGFRPDLLAPMRHKLAALCNVLFEPFACDGKYDLGRWRRSQRVADILGDDRWNFRMSGPPQLIFILRAFRGLTFYLHRLGASAAWSIALRPHLARYRRTLDAFDASAAPQQTGTFNGLARCLKIRVMEGPRQKVGITFLAEAVDDLDELMDDELRRRVEASGIDVDAIVRRVRRSAYAPQDLFRVDDSDTGRSIRVWLE